MLTARQARKLWDYDPETGIFCWKISPKHDVLVGSRAGWFDGKYWRITFQGKRYKASRVAWLYVTGKWPKDQIDHKDGNKLNDRFDNLRDATNAQNCRNRAVKNNNKLGIKGVYQRKYGFVAQVWLDGKPMLNKHFKTLAEAKAAYDAVATNLHGEYARL